MTRPSKFYDWYDDCNFGNKIIYLSKSYEAEEGEHRTGHILCLLKSKIK